MRRVRDVSLVVGRGEIVGLAGLVGAGRSELLETIVGIRPRAAGVVEVDGNVVGKGVRSAINRGLILVAEDRSRQAVLPTLSVRDNATLTLPLARHRFFRRRQREDEAVDPLLETLDVRYASRDQPFAALSGGNQQKVLLARALLVSPRVVMLDEPTSGIDIGAKHRIYQQIIELASEGLGVLVASSELPELLAVCHRIAVVREGEIVGELDQRQMTEEGIVALATGAGSRAA
jgi:ABC-type sugar transport system ATPase subunit